MSRTIDKGIDGRLRLKRELNREFNTKAVNGMALNHSPIQREMIYSGHQHALNWDRQFQGGRQDSNAACRAPKSELVLQNDMMVGSAE